MAHFFPGARSGWVTEKLLNMMMRVIPSPKVQYPYPMLWWWAIAINGVALLIAAWVFMAYLSNRSPLDIALLPALTGIFVLPLLARGQFRLVGFGDPYRPSLSPGFHALLLVIGLHALEDQTLLDRSKGLWAGAIFGLSLGGLLLWFLRPVKRVAALVLVAVLIFAAWGVIQITNCLLDNSVGVVLRTQIGEGYVTLAQCSGSLRFPACSGSVSQHVLLSPPPYGFPQDLSVGGWYYRTKPGDSICLTEHPGRFGARWYSFDMCP